MPIPNYATQQQAAEHFKVTPRTIRNWVSRGLITAYRMPSGRAIRVRIDEIEAMLDVIPTRKARTPATAFGPKARVRTVTR